MEANGKCPCKDAWGKGAEEPALGGQGRETGIAKEMAEKLWAFLCVIFAALFGVGRVTRVPFLQPHFSEREPEEQSHAERMGNGALDL